MIVVYEVHLQGWCRRVICIYSTIEQQFPLTETSQKIVLYANH